MKSGRVVGEVWASRRVAGLAGQSLKLVVTGADAAADGADHETVRADDPALAWASLSVAIDTLDARVGQRVLLAYGSGARNVIAPGPDNRHLLCDAAIALLVDGCDAAAVGSASAPDPSAAGTKPGPHPAKTG